MKLKRLIPPPVRRTLRKIERELPHRLADLPADLADLTWRRGAALPPPGLRFDVAGSSSRNAFVEIGSRAAEDIWLALEPHVGALEPPIGGAALDVLDYGCGCGRVAGPLMGRLGARARLHGADVDAAAIRWCQRHLAGEYRVIGEDLRLPFDDGSIDVAYSVSVFTHLSEEDQRHWLAEVRRTLRPGGLFAATTLSPALAHTRADLTAGQLETLRTKGFVFAAGPGPFNDDSAFHSADYLRRAWSPWFEMLSHRQHGLAGYQDLAVFRAR